jgi:hypothetical protein
MGLALATTLSNAVAASEPLDPHYAGRWYRFTAPRKVRVAVEVAVQIVKHSMNVTQGCANGVVPVPRSGKDDQATPSLAHVHFPQGMTVDLRKIGADIL